MIKLNETKTMKQLSNLDISNHISGRFERLVKNLGSTHESVDKAFDAFIADICKTFEISPEEFNIFETESEDMLDHTPDTFVLSMTIQPKDADHGYDLGRILVLKIEDVNYFYLMTPAGNIDTIIQTTNNTHN